MTDLRALVERGRNLYQGCGDEQHPKIFAWIDEAASALERLAARVEELESVNKDLRTARSLVVAFNETLTTERDALLMKAYRISGALADAGNVLVDFEYAEESIRLLTSERDALRQRVEELENRRSFKMLMEMKAERDALRSRVERMEGLQGYGDLVDECDALRAENKACKRMIEELLELDPDMPSAADTERRAEEMIKP